MLGTLSYTNQLLKGFLSHLLSIGADDSPDYQRGYAWTDEDKERYYESLFRGNDLGRFIIVTYPYPRKDELFDGKQRVNALMELMRSVRPYKGVYWHQMSANDRSQVLRRSVQVAEVSATKESRADLLQMFLDVNKGGVPQTEAHLAHVTKLLRDEQDRLASLAAMNGA